MVSNLIINISVIIVELDNQLMPSPAQQYFIQTFYCYYYYIVSLSSDVSTIRDYQSRLM